MIWFDDWWRSFKHNYCWSDHVGYIDGWIPKASLSMSFLGYLILFNDANTDLITFANLTTKDEINISLSDEININLSDNVISINDNVISPSDEININLSDNIISLNGNIISPSDNVISPSDNVISPSDDVISLSDNARLKMIYFAFLFLGVSNLLYHFLKPYHFKCGTNLIQFSKNALETYNIGSYIAIHDEIRTDNYGPRTLGGEYYTSEWDGFIEAARNTREGTENVMRDGDWERAKSQYGSLLRGMLEERFFRRDTDHRIRLSICFILSTIGYVFLLIPSVDLLIKVLRATF